MVAYASGTLTFDPMALNAFVMIDAFLFIVTIPHESRDETARYIRSNRLKKLTLHRLFYF